MSAAPPAGPGPDALDGDRADALDGDRGDVDGDDLDGDRGDLDWPVAGTTPAGDAAPVPGTGARAAAATQARPENPRPPGRAGAPAGRGARQSAWKAVFFVVTAAAIVAGVAWALLGSRFLVVRSVKVEGTGPQVSRARVVAAAGIPGGLPLIRVNSAAVARRVERITQVLSARVTRDWPDTVVISIRLRTPVFAVKLSGGYGLVDPFGVDVRRVSRRPRGLPLLTVVATGASRVTLRGSPAVHAAAVVLHELPRRIAAKVTAVTATTSSDVSVKLTTGVTVVWGGTGRPARKARELAILMHTHAQVYDVSGQDTAVTRG